MTFSCLCLSAATSAGMVPCRMIAVRIYPKKLKDHVRNPLTRLRTRPRAERTTVPSVSVACHPVACSYCAPLEGAAPHAHAHGPSPPPPPQNRR